MATNKPSGFRRPDLLEMTRARAMFWYGNYNDVVAELFFARTIGMPLCFFLGLAFVPVWQWVASWL